MRIDTIVKILELHFIPYMITGDGRILADSMIGGTRKFEITEDVTDWSRRQLYDWLGY